MQDHLADIGPGGFKRSASPRTNDQHKPTMHAWGKLLAPTSWIQLTSANIPALEPPRGSCHECCYWFMWMQFRPKRDYIRACVQNIEVITGSRLRQGDSRDCCATQQGQTGQPSEGTRSLGHPSAVPGTSRTRVTAASPIDGVVSEENSAIKTICQYDTVNFRSQAVGRHAAGISQKVADSDPLLPWTSSFVMNPLHHPMSSEPYSQSSSSFISATRFFREPPSIVRPRKSNKSL